MPSVGFPSSRGFAKSIKQSSWNPYSVDEALCAKLAADCNILPITARLMLRRGLTDASAVNQFLNPNLQQLLDPMNLHGMQPAVERILQALKNRQTIMIHGDYDADGVTSTALLYRFFRHLKQIPLIYIPNRLTENHGINVGAVDLAKEKKVALFITCDCGISSAAEIRELKQAGIDCIVTDHHLIPDSGAPDAAIVINPTQSECNFADQGMTGVGIAFYLIIALRRYLREQGMFNSGEISEPNLREYLDLVTLGTIADQAPLIGQNRIFVKNGLPLIANTEKMGLRVLLNLTTPADRQLNVMDIAFSVAPKLNAAGRLGKAQDAFDLLIEDDPIRAAVLARKLVQYNDERRRIEEQQLREVFGEAERFVSAQDLKLGKMPAGLVVYRPHWHLGIVGILSSKLTDRFRCPTIVLSSFGDRIKGSGRSVQGISLIDTLRPCAAHLVTYGGHAMAGGVSLKEENLESFREQWVETLTQQRVGGSENTIATDGLLSIGDISDRLLEEISRLEPFGEGNPEPLFQIEGVLPKQIRRMGDQKQHLRLTLAAGSGATVAAVGFSMGDFAKFNEQIWNVLATPEYNHWQGRRSTQLRLHNIQLIDSLPSAS